MLFNSVTFVIFFLITFLIYYLPLLKKWQVPILVIASFIFYAWSSPALLILLIISILLNAWSSYKVANTLNKKQRFWWATLGVIINLTILGLFKYAGLFTKVFLDLFNLSPTDDSFLQVLLTLPLPVGISFYTFQGISLVIDVLREQEGRELQETDTSPSHFAHTDWKSYLLDTSFFISLFPQLVAGPIVKAHDFFPQIQPKYFQNIRWDIVFRCLVIGYFLKMVIADNLKDYTFWINYPYYQGMGTITLVVLLLGYSMQIFADFAGYSLIAIGLGAALGYTLPQNFNFPYISRSLSEFWTRWHISLSTWLKSYLYIPLGGNRKGNVRTYFNLMIVMALGGLWHGAGWSYAVWGIYHGVGLAIERFLHLNRRNSNFTEQSAPLWQQFIRDFLQILLIFSFVSLGWLLFKLPRFDQALDFLVTMGKNLTIRPQMGQVVPVLIFSLPVLIYHGLNFPTWKQLNPQSVRLGSYRLTWIWDHLALGLMLVAILINSGSSGAFIYFQF